MWVCTARFTPALALLAALALGLPSAHGQSPCRARASAERGEARAWPPPLDRRVSFRARDESLRDALGQLAAAAHLRLSYSAELLPLDRRVCVSYDSVAVGDALAGMLRGAAVEPRVVGSDHVVLAPAPAAAGAAPDSGLARTTAVLDRVIVTGSAGGAPQRPLPVAVDVLSGPQLERRIAGGTLSQALDGAVPGLWLWEQSPSSLLAHYGSIRGASSFGASYPKVYIDGIEVANPLVVSRLNPEMVERVEVIRGPQGAALYGADAISGVVNIVTRTDGVASGAPRVRLRSEAGTAASDFASRAALTQQHALTLRGGSSASSAGLGVVASSVGAFVPDAYSRQVTAMAGARVVGQRSVVTGTARFFAEQAATPASPLLNDSVYPPTMPPPPGGYSGGDPRREGEPQSVQEYTLGATARFTPGERWTHVATLGLDGYRLTDVPDESLPIPSAVDAAVRAARGAADRATLRLSSVAQWGASARASAALTLAAEHSLLREQASFGDEVTGGVRQSDGPHLRAAFTEYRTGARFAPSLVTWRSNTGLIAQTNVTLRDALYLSGGLRLERDDGFAGFDQWTTLPMVGAALVRGRGDVTLKLRAAYGKGIRPQRSAIRETVWTGVRQANLLSSLAPEQQSGVEAGADLFVGRALTLRVTRFDQLASGLIQRVLLGVDTLRSGVADRRRGVWGIQNVGAIANRGWELESSLALGRLALGGSLSFVDSRVRRTAAGYTGDLRPGDRMLEVPARTASLSASWTGAHWSGSLTAARAADWVNYDRLALAWAYANGDVPEAGQLGPWLRTFWRDYEGVTRLRATFARDLRRGLAVVLTGDNLLDRQRGEPDNVTILPGRTVTAGLRLDF